MRASGSGVPGAPVYGVHGTMASTSSVFNPDNNNSDPAIPLTSATYQQWDSNGRAIGYAQDPTLHTPKPQTANSAGFLQSDSTNPRYPRDEEEGQRGRRFDNERHDSGDVAGWDMSPRPLPPPTNRRMSAQAQAQQQRPQYEDPFAVGQTPTQANFSQPQRTHRKNQSSYGDPYGGYATPGHGQGHGHTQEPISDSYRTAYTGSPDRLHNPHSTLPVGAMSPSAYPGSSNPYPFALHAQGSQSSQPNTTRRGVESPRPPSYMTNIR